MPNLCLDTIRRFLIVPDEEVATCRILRAVATTDDTRQEAGLSIRQPSTSTTSACAGDIRPTLGGPVETHIAGQIVVNKPGVVEDARFGWVRDGDDTTTDLQLRQSPHVVGRRVDVIKHFGDDTIEPSSTRRFVRPKLLPLASGDLLAVWYEASWTPVFGRQATTLATVAEVIMLSKLDHTSDTWSDPAYGPVPSDVSGTNNFVAGVDMIQFSDTGEIILLVLVNKSMTPGSADPRRLFVFSSTDDGANWSERARRHFDGVMPDILLDTDGDGVMDDTTPLQCIAVERLASGRIVAMVLTENSTWSLTSDDRGASWAATLVETHLSDYQYTGHGVGSTTFRNGLACFHIAKRGTVDWNYPTALRITADGINYSSAIDVSPNISTVDVTVCVSPDGWPHLYGTAHMFLNPEALLDPNFSDWLWGRRFLIRDPKTSSTTEELFPTTVAGSGVPRTYAFHIVESDETRNSYALTESPGLTRCPIYQGFVGIDAVTYRGQVVLMTVATRDHWVVEHQAEQPEMIGSALVVYRLNHWQPIQEQLGQSHPSTSVWTPEFPAGGYIYNRTWDCYGKPDLWGFTENGAGTTTMVYGGPEGGYMEIVSPDNRSYTDASFPAPDSGREGMIRFVVQAVEGGSATSDRIAVRFFCSDGTSSAGTINIRLERTTDGTYVHLINWQTSALVGSALFPNDQWIEVLGALKHKTSGYECEVFARNYPRSTDPDWDEPYTFVGAILNGTASAIGDGVVFGNMEDQASKSWWKSVHISRVDASGKVDLKQWSAGEIEQDAFSDMTAAGTGEPRLDSGIDNLMRTPPAMANPPQFLTRGAAVAWRGEATTDGSYDFSAGYDFGADRLLTVPALRQWRSVDDNKEVEIVLDADPDGEGRTFRPNAIAMIGRNFPEFTVQWSDVDADSYWSSADGCRFGYYYDGHSPQRYAHIWGMHPGKIPVGWTYNVAGRRLTVYGPGETAQTIRPWRPHQFRSLRDGPKFYAAFSKTGVTYVYRIEDNTEDTITFVTAPTLTDMAVETTEPVGWYFNSNWSVFSDRMASTLEHRYPATYDPGDGELANSHSRGYRYIRLLVHACVHRDADEAFMRCGLLYLGRAIELSSPAFMWGFKRSESSGSQVEYDDGGVSTVRRKHAPRRELSVDYSYMKPPEEMAAAYNSPDDAMPDGTHSWQHWVDAVRRLEIDNTPVILVWEGDRFVASATDPSSITPPSCACDPKDLLLCRVTRAGEVEHVVFSQATQNLAAGATTLPRPAATVRGIVFTEEF